MITFHLSGGVANALPDLSLGGVMSATEVGKSVVTTQGAGISGVTILGGIGVATGGALALDAEASPKTLTFTPYGIAVGSVAADFQNHLTLHGDGVYSLTWAQNGKTASVDVAITIASLPGASAATLLTSVPPATGLFDAVDTLESSGGAVEHRCIYVRNDYAATKTLGLWLAKVPLASGIDIGFDPAGVGGIAQAIAGPEYAPASVVFVRPRTPDDGLSVALHAGASVALWIRRVVSALTPMSASGDGFFLACRSL
jgi:hypothetical protein